MKKRSINFYVIAVLVVIAIMNCFAWFVNGGENAATIEIFSSGFLVGILAMYIAIHFYRT